MAEGGWQISDKLQTNDGCCLTSQTRVDPGAVVRRPPSAIRHPSSSHSHSDIKLTLVPASLLGDCHHQLTATLAEDSVALIQRAHTRPARIRCFRKHTIGERVIEIQ